jgi:hypothetical protein
MEMLFIWTNWNLIILEVGRRYKPCKNVRILNNTLEIKIYPSRDTEDGFWPSSQEYTIIRF